MNRRLLDPFQSVELPEIIEEYLEQGTALCLAFNRRGTLLASGTREGQLVIWDFDTRGVAAVYEGHEGAVTSLAWSRDSRHIVTGSEDKHVVLWSAEDGKQVARVAVPSAVTQVCLSPRPPYRCVVSLADDAPLLVGLQEQPPTLEPLQLPVDTDGPQQQQAAGRVKLEGGAGGGGGAAGPGAPSSSSGAPALGTFSKGADLVILAQAKAVLAVMDAATRAVLDVVRVPNSARITGLVLNRKGSLLLATCQDQRLRLYDVMPRSALPAGGAGAPPTDQRIREALASKAIKSGSLLHGGPDAGLLRPVREFQNAVERTPWRAATFSCDSEHVVGAIAAKAQHQAYIWNRPLGNMERILDGPKEGVVDLAWHPVRSLLLTCSSTGRIYIWAKVYAENWSAFAPDFKELDENIEYVEAEDEFDWATPGAGGQVSAKGAAAAAAGAGLASAAEPAATGGAGAGAGGPDPSMAAAEPLDILTREPEALFSSDDEDGVRGELRYLPVVVEPEEPAPTARGAAAGVGTGAGTARTSTAGGAGGGGGGVGPVKEEGEEDGNGDAVGPGHDSVKQEAAEGDAGGGGAGPMAMDDEAADAQAQARKRKVQFGDGPPQDDSKISRRGR